jgi:hypothetical protein
MARSSAALLIFLAPFIFVQSKAQGIAEQKDAVAFIFGTVHQKMPDGKVAELDLPLGTAFFVGYSDARLGPELMFPYLVTAKHVLRDLDGAYLKEIRLRVNPKGGGPCGFITNIPVSDAQGNLLWFHDDDSAVDVAATPVTVSLESVQVRTIPLSMFADDATLKKENVAEGDALYFIGLMAQYYGVERNYPVVRRGTFALMTDEMIDTPTGRQNAYIAELASWPGNSGSPVSLSLGGLRGSQLLLGAKIQFLGILSGSFLNRVNATLLNATTIAAGDAAETGISFIVPASKLKSVLDSAPAQALRDSEIAKRNLAPTK